MSEPQEPKYRVGDEVTWKRGDLSDGFGAIDKVIGDTMYRVRDARGNRFVYSENELTKAG